jgi:hypothetical protein
MGFEDRSILDQRQPSPALRRSRGRAVSGFDKLFGIEEIGIDER